MISCMTYDSQGKELRELETIMKDEAAYACEEKWIWQFLEHWEEAGDWLEKGPLLDLACLDVTDPEVLGELEAFRKKYQKTLLMVIADGNVSPMCYLKPSVFPASLLLRPADKNQIRQVVREFFEAFCRERGEKEPRETFVVETREGKTWIPYEQIVFFEAREKKVFVRAGISEYGLYDTLENIQGRLPDDFLRCHRSYIVNKKQIERVRLSQNLIEMKDGAGIPVSRSYRTDVKNI
ncbi:MAG: LytR/AlgR family response regulator transcription factor [Ruminococcus sp.]|jgi:DNA-binding LytR/AlgR family response regulator